MIMKIIFEREKCIGCGSCEALCSKYWKMADDGKVDYLGSEELKEGETGCNKEAADACPVQCIRIENK